MKTRIGFIGLGVMGEPMASNLIDAGYFVTVYARKAEVLQRMEHKGAQVAKSLRDVARASDVIITMLPDSPEVEEVVLGEAGVLKGASSGSLLIDMSSIAPKTIEYIAKVAKEKGVIVLDAPVSGGESKAKSGELSIMVGGPQESFEEVRPILGVLGSSIVRTGEVGSGNVTKLANQVMVAVHIAAMAEAMTLVQKAGLDPSVVFEAIRGGSAGSAVMENKLPKILERNFKPGFRLELHRKDLKNALNTAEELGTPMPLSHAVMEMFKELIEQGEGALDHTAMVHYYESLAHTEIHRHEK